MKKFLSLVLAMIMTMSLVTISAGATEYKDLTDKDEIQYEEAVAVLNRIGVITGYEDGSFRPDTELTRGAAAKIIVSLMIGPDAASALPNTSSPYPDVPASHTFAGVISYCKTLGYISGYGDGTFKPADPLTGYAFSKMLLGALGYSSDIERFTGTGWTMNVARIGNVAGLFDRISFDGAAAVTRDQACQLALNTLKATMVTYGGTSIINGSTGSYTIQGTDAKPITSNNRDINANIGRKDWYGGNNQSSDYLTLEFGEEHFKDLRLEHDKYDPAHDDFGRPSNEWSYKKVTIGTFPLPADFTFTTQVAHVEATDGVKEKALGLSKYELKASGGYSEWHGWSGNGNGNSSILEHDYTWLWLNGDKNPKTLSKIANIADYTDNGTLVEVYVSYVDADWITDVVVVQTQLMKVKKIASDYVTLENVDPDVAEDGEPNGEANVGFNFAAIDVKLEEVKDTNEDCYAVLTGLKEGDYVAVVPVTTDDGTTYEAAEVYVPETVSGSLTRVDTYGIGSGDDERGAISITVGGTAYKLADWNKDMWSLTDKEIKATRKDATLYMDKYGNALFADDIGKIEDFMVIGRFYQSVVGTKVCTFVQGWDIKGKELDLNLGSSVRIQNHGTDKSVYGHVIGELVHFTSEGATGDADYVLNHKDVHDVYTNLRNTDSERTAVPDFDPLDKDNTANYEIKASNLLVPLADEWADGTQLNGSWRNQTSEDANPRPGATYDQVKYHNYYYEKGVNFIYVTESDDHTEIDSIEVKSGVQNVSHSELYQAIYQWRSQAAVKKDQVVAVVIKRESNDANLSNMLYVMNYLGMKEYDKETGEKGFGVEVLMYKDGKWVRDDIIVDKDLAIGAYATYSKRDSAKYVDNYYHVKNFNRHNANPGVLFSDDVFGVDVRDPLAITGKENYSTALLRLNSAYAVNYKGDKSGVALLGLAGMDASDDAKSYVMGDYRGVSTTIDSGYVHPEGIIVTKNATWLNMSKDLDRDGKDWSKVDFKDAKDFVEKVVAKNYKYELTVLLNEKPDSDGFRTAYLIVIDKITYDGKGGGGETGDVVYTGADVATIFGSGNRTGSAAMNSFGYLDLKYNFTAPNWVTSGSTFAATYSIYADLGAGKGFELFQAGLTTTGTVSASKGGVISDLTLRSIPASAKIRVEITDITYNDVAVRYYNGSIADANEIPSSAWVTAPADHADRTSGLVGRPYQVKNTVYSTYAATDKDVKNVTGYTASASFNPTATTESGANEWTLSTTTMTPTGKGPVNVILGTLAKNTKFSIDNSKLSTDMKAAVGGATTGTGVADAIVDLDSTKTGENSTLAVNFKVAGAAKMSNIEAGDTVTVEAVMSAAPVATGVAAYKVSVVLAGTTTAWTETIELTVFNNTAKTGTFVMPNEHVEVTSVTITKAADKLDIDEVTAAYDAGKHQLIVTFNEEIAKDADATDLKAQIAGAAGTGKAKVTDVAIDGNKLVIDLATALADNETIIIPTGKIVNGVTKVDDLGANPTTIKCDDAAANEFSVTHT